jgi:hypothetical protein
MSLIVPEALPLDGLDVYYHPAYLRSVGDDVRVLVRDDLILPLVVHPIPDSDLCDAESPYGYAAPIARGPVDWEGVRAELAAAGIVNAFLRSHPLEPWIDLPEVFCGPTVAIPVGEGRAAAFAGGRCATHRSQVNRARSLGFTATVASPPQDLTVFRALYERTMERLAAADFYRFGDASWAALSGLGERLALVTVADPAGVVHNQALFLRGPRWAHYHLSARSGDAHNASGHLLFEAAADWAVAHGCHAIHLGGGTTGRADDGLLLYKRRIGRQDALFRTAGLITRPDDHAALIAAWQTRTGGTPRWFQAYRQGLR